MWGNHPAQVCGKTGREAVIVFERWINEVASYAWKGRAKIDLAGKNLACFCKLCDEHKDGKPFTVDCRKCEPCHSDVLGRLANPHLFCEAV